MDSGNICASWLALVVLVVLKFYCELLCKSVYIEKFKKL